LWVWVRCGDGGFTDLTRPGFLRVAPLCVAWKAYLTLGLRARVEENGEPTHAWPTWA
jgi:hypothetical protein